MSFSGKKPVFKKIYTQKTDYKNYTTMPEPPPHDYYSVYFRFGRPYFMDNYGAETSLLQDLVLSESFAVRDFVFEGEPVFLYKEGDISFRSENEKYFDFNRQIQEKSFPVGVSETDQILASDYFSDHFFPNIATLIKGVNKDIFGFEHNTTTAVDLNINTDLASCGVNQLNPEEKNIVYHRNNSIFYRKYNREFEPISDEQKIISVSNLKYLKCICYTLKNDLINEDTEDLFVVIYVDDSGLNTALFRFTKKRKSWTDGRNDVDSVYLEEYLNPYYSRSLNVLFKGASLIQSANADDFNGGAIKHIHIGRTLNNETCKFYIVVEKDGELVDYIFESSDVTLTEKTITYIGCSPSRYPNNTSFFGSLSMLSGRDDIYYTINNTIYIPSNSGMEAIDLSGEGVIRGLIPIAKNENITILFIDRTIELSVIPNNGYYYSRTTLENNFIMPEGVNFTISGLFNPDEFEDYKINTLRTLLIYIDTNGRFNTRKLNDLDNIIDDKPSPNIINTIDSNIINRFIKPITGSSFIISGEENNKVKFYNYVSDILEEYSLEIQDETTGIKPYVLPIRYATNVRRYIVASIDKNNNTRIKLDARTTTSHGIPYTPVSPAATFELNDPVFIKDILLLKDGLFLIQNSISSISVFNWDESTSTMTRELFITKNDLNGNNIINIANGNNGVFIISTMNDDNSVVELYKVDSDYNITLLKTITGVTNKCFSFSFESGIMCIISNNSDEYINVYSNAGILLNEFNFNGLISGDFIDDALNGFCCSTLKDIRAGNSRYTFIYNHENRIPTLTKTVDNSYNLLMTKHDNVVMPETSLKPSKLLSRAFFEESGDFSNILIDFTGESLPISDTVSFYPSANVIDISMFAISKLSNNKSIFAFTNIENELHYHIIEDGLITNSSDYGEQLNILEIKPFVSYNNHTVIAVRRTDSITLLDGINNITISTESIKSFDIVTFKTSVVLMILDNNGDLYANTFIFNNDNTIIHKVQNELYKTGVENFSLSSPYIHFATILINSNSGSVLESFMINEYFVIDDTTVLNFNPNKNELALNNGVVSNETQNLYYWLDDNNKIFLLESPQGKIELTGKTYNYKNLIIIPRDDRLEIYELDTNQSTLVESIRFRVSHIFRDYTVSEEGIITAITSRNSNWYINQYKINHEQHEGVYVGVTQEDAQFPFSSVAALRGGISSVHSGLPTTEKVYSSDGSIELGLAISPSQIHLSYNDVQHVETPSNIEPLNNGVLLDTPTTLYGSSSGRSLYNYNITKRHWRIATDKQFNNIVYEATNVPYQDNHTLTAVDWLQEKRVFYWQCQDENERGYKSQWSKPFTFSVSIDEEIAVPTIESPQQDDVVDLTFTVNSSSFDANPSQDHVSSNWEIYQDGILIYSSYNDTVNLTSYNIDSSVGLESDSSYSIRVSYTGSITGTSAYSELVTVRTDDTLGIVAVTEEDYPNIRIYRQDIDSLFLDTSDYAIDSPCNAVSVFSNKLYIAVGHTGGGNLTIFKNMPSDIVKLNIINPPTSPVLCLDSYSDYLAVGKQNTDYLSIYKRAIDDSFLKMAVVFNDITGSVTDCKFSFDGEYLAVSTSNAPFLHVYKRDGDSFTPIEIQNKPTNICSSVAISFNGNRLLTTIQSNPFILSYELEGSEYVLKNNLDELPITAVNKINFRPDGERFVIGMDVFPYIRVYERDGNIFKARIIFTSNSDSSIRDVRFSSNGNYILAGMSNTPYMITFKEMSQNYARIAPPDVEVDSSVRSVSFIEE